MNNDDFEGYIGTYIDDSTFSNDAILLVAFILLSVFALIFRLNMPLFGKMLSNINADEQRQSIFETTAKDSFFFNAFMAFQTLLLCGVSVFSIAVYNKFLTKPDALSTILTIIGLLVLFFLFYLLKRSIYITFGYIFSEKSSYKMMLINYQSLFCIWGVTLYIPVLWILLVGEYLLIAYLLMALNYLLFRIILIYRFIHIFFNKNTGLLFLSLYLCAQEIIPLVFLYEGLIYLYNIIEKNNI